MPSIATIELQDLVQTDEHYDAQIISPLLEEVKFSVPKVPCPSISNDSSLLHKEDDFKEESADPRKKRKDRSQIFVMEKIE